MKKALALIMVLCMVLGICGCKSQPDNLSSDSVEVEYEEIIVDQSGSTITSSEQNTTSGQDVQSNQTTSSDITDTTVDNSVSIDYDTIVEVDICDDIVRGYLSAKDATNQYYWLSNFSGTAYDYQNLSLSWKMAGGPYTVYFSENADFSNAITLQTSSVTMKNSILVPGKTYYWKVIGAFSDDVLGGGRIKVKDAPVRFITVDGTRNVRDMGGWKTESGKTVKYEMLYRGPNIDNITDVGIATIKQLGIKTELDIRRPDQKSQKAGTGMNYIFLESHAQYDRIFDPSYKAEVQNNYKKIFELLSNESNYPFYTHCQHGADRTGTYAFIVNGVLGVSYEDLTRDFETTSFSSGYKRWRGEGKGGTFAATDTIMQNDEKNYVAWGELYKHMMEKYGTGDGKLSSAIENYLVNYIGVPKSQIDSFRNIMLK